MLGMIELSVIKEYQIVIIIFFILFCSSGRTSPAYDLSDLILVLALLLAHH